MRRRQSDNYVIDAFFELLWGIEIALICVVVDYFFILNLLEKLHVPCNNTATCSQSLSYNCLYGLSILIWIFAAVYPLTIFIIALVKGYKAKKG